ncbi:MAG: hypothetical protein ACOYJ2_03165 [Rickettsiales bacterium]
MSEAPTVKPKPLIGAIAFGTVNGLQDFAAGCLTDAKQAEHGGKLRTLDGWVNNVTEYGSFEDFFGYKRKGPQYTLLPCTVSGQKALLISKVGALIDGTGNRQGFIGSGICVNMDDISDPDYYKHAMVELDRLFGKIALGTNGGIADGSSSIAINPSVWGSGPSYPKKVLGEFDIAPPSASNSLTQTYNLDWLKKNRAAIQSDPNILF